MIRGKFEERAPKGFPLDRLFLEGPIVLFQWKNEPDWPVTYVSPNVQLILGYTENDFYSGRVSYRSIIHPDDLDMVIREVQNATINKLGSFTHHPYRIKHKDGTWLWLQDHTTIFWDRNTKQPTDFIGYIQDITLQHNTKLEFLENEEKLKAVINYSPIAIAMYDTKMNFIVVNAKWKSIFAIEEINGRSHYELFPDTTERWKNIHQKCLHGYSGSGHGEFYQKNDGEILRLSWEIQPWYNNNGKIAGIIHFIQDITQEWLAKEEQSKSFNTLTSILDNLNAAVYVSDLETYELYFANKYLKNQLGSIDGKKCWEVLHKGMTGPCPFCNNKKLLSDTGFPTGIINWEHYNKQLARWFAVSDTAIEWHKSKFVRLEIAYDITKQKNTEIYLQQSENHYKQMFETNQAIKLIIAKKNYNILDANGAACLFYGYDHSQLTKMNFFDLLNNPSQFEIERINSQFNNKRFYLQLNQKTKHNINREVEIYSGPIEFDDQAAIYAIIHDITDRKLAQMELSQRDQILFAVSQAAQILFKIEHLSTSIPIILRILGETTKVNCACIFQNKKVSEGKLLAIRKHYWTSDEEAHKDVIKEFQDLDYQNLGQKKWLSNLFGGDSIFANVDKLTGAEKDFFEKKEIKSFLILPINTSSTWWGFIGFFVSKKSDTVKEWSIFESELLKSAAGILGSAIERESILHELRDLNRNLESKVQHQLEENRKKDHMLIAQSRLAGMGEMMGNIAHQWRQPITVLSLIFQDLKESLEYNELNMEKMQESEAEVKQIVAHLSTTIDDFRDFYKPTKQKSFFFIYKDSLDKIISFVQTRLAKLSIKIKWRMLEDIEIKGYPGEYSQVFLNMINNAIDAFQDRKIKNPEILIQIRKKNNRSLLVIADNAGGIEESILSKVFDPYFTTKEKGTGIGLYMSKMIIEQSMLGSLTVFNSKKGAVFQIIV